MLHSRNKLYFLIFCQSLKERNFSFKSSTPWPIFFIYFVAFGAKAPPKQHKCSKSSPNRPQLITAIFQRKRFLLQAPLQRPICCVCCSLGGKSAPPSSKYDPQVIARSSPNHNQLSTATIQRRKSLFQHPEQRPICVCFCHFRGRSAPQAANMPPNHHQIFTKS